MNRERQQYVAQIASGALVRVLEDRCPPFSGYFLYYPGRRQQQRRCATSTFDAASGLTGVWNQVMSITFDDTLVDVCRGITFPGLLSRLRARPVTRPAQGRDLPMYPLC